MAKGWRVWRRWVSQSGCPHSVAPDDPRIARAEEAIVRLPERTREVFIMSYDCLARRLGIDSKEIEAHMAATLIALRRALKDTD